MFGGVAILFLIGLSVAAGCGDEEEPAPATTATSSAATTADGAQEHEADRGQDEEHGAGGEDQIAIGRPTSLEDTIEAVLTGSRDAALICDVLVTADHVRTAYGAREGCIAAQKPGALADSVEVRETDAGDGTASAIVVPAGGPYDGVEVEVELVRGDGGWQVDSLLADVPPGP